MGYYKKDTYPTSLRFEWANNNEELINLKREGNII
jgi:hypothetical protein